MSEGGPKHDEAGLLKTDARVLGLDADASTASWSALGGAMYASFAGLTPSLKKRLG